MNEAKLIQLIKKYRVPSHINGHMKTVAAVAIFIGQKLLQNGHKIDLVLVRQAALLHDIVKITDFKTVDTKFFTKPPLKNDIIFFEELIAKYGHIRHVEAGYQVLMAADEPVIALIIKKHGLNSLLDSTICPQTLEEKVIYYADKRVRHDEIVTITDRLKDLRDRYNNHDLFQNAADFSKPDPAREKILESKIFELEAEICIAAGIKPDSINATNIADFLEK